MPARPRAPHLLHRRLAVALAVVVGLGGLSGCVGEEEPAATPSRSEAPTTRPEPLTAEQRVARKARRLVAGMTLAEKAGQVLVPSWAGGPAPRRELARLHLGGVIALPGERFSPDEVRRLNGVLAKQFRRRGYPGFLSVDQEGGNVARVGAPLTRLPTFMATGAAADPALTRRAARATAAELRSLGFTVVFAPVADVTVGRDDPAIGSRSAGDDPEAVARQVVAAASGIEQAGLVPVLKHFPGHGSVPVDSHTGLPVQTRSVRRLMRTDLVPFREAVAAGAPAVMTAHIRVRALDRREPATASRSVTTGLLRERLGFDGLVVTDALNMAGIQDLHRGPRAALSALQAGADVLLMPVQPRRSRDRIVRAVLTGRLSIARLDEAATRMLTTLLEAQSRRRAARLGSAAQATRALERAAVTSVGGPCSGTLMARKVRVVGDPGVVARFDAIARSNGVTIAQDRRVRVPDGKVRKKVGTRRKKVGRKRVWVGEDEDRRRVWRPLYEKVPVYRKVRKYRWVLKIADAPTVALVGYGDRWPTAADVLVALDRPDVLGSVGARVRLATFGEGDGSLRALVDVLLGREPAPGRLPVRVGGVERRGCGS